MPRHVKKSVETIAYSQGEVLELVRKHARERLQSDGVLQLQVVRSPDSFEIHVTIEDDMEGKVTDLDGVVDYDEDETGGPEDVG